MEMDLDVRVRALLRSGRATYDEVSENCDISKSWIVQFVRGKITNPGYKTLTGVYEYLAQLEPKYPLNRGRPPMKQAAQDGKAAPPSVAGMAKPSRMQQPRAAGVAKPSGR